MNFDLEEGRRFSYTAEGSPVRRGVRKTLTEAAGRQLG